jgi:hypothetical protein
MPPTIRRQIFLDHGRVTIDLPRIMTDDQFADILEGFVAKVRGRPPPSAPPEPPPGNLPKVRNVAKRKR